MSFPSDFWNQRYAEAADYVYGTAPNVFFAQQLQQLKPGKLLLPFEGEGRNAVWAASQGWEVACFDFSSTGRDKALQLAQKAGVTIAYAVSDFRKYDWKKQHYDVVGLFYAHQPEESRKQLHAAVLETLEIGGILLLEAFSTAQLGKKSGGPQSLDMLYSAELLHDDFAALRNRVIQEELVMLDEGPGHRGEASVLRLAGMR